MASRTKLDRAGRRYSPAELHKRRAGHRPPNKGKQYPPDPPPREEVLRVAECAEDDPQGWRSRALIGLLWSGLTISEALQIGETAADLEDGTVRVPGGHARHAKLDEWSAEQILGWLPHRFELPTGPLLCILRGPTAGQNWSTNGARVEMRRLASRAGVTRRFAPHQLRWGCALHMVEQGASFAAVHEQLGLSSAERNHRAMMLLKILAQAENGTATNGQQTDRLWCQEGEHWWRRERHPGRKPSACPKHAAARVAH